VKDVAVIIPTIREYKALTAYLDNARAAGFPTDRLLVFLVAEDSSPLPEMRAYLKDAGVEGEVYGQKERDAWFDGHGLGASKGVVPRRSHAETSFGLLRMLEDPSLKYGVFIDDDTSPIAGQDYFGTHLANLQVTGKHLEVSTGPWVDVLRAGSTLATVPPRGFPFGVSPASPQERQVEVKRVVCSQGLWTQTPDFDAVRILAVGGPRVRDGIPGVEGKGSNFARTFAAPIGSPITICSMNLAFVRDIIPAFYQFPMDDNQWGVGRFDDIWSGLVLKRVADSFGWHTLHGLPLCRHAKAGRNVFRDLSLEAAGLHLNEVMADILAKVEVDGPLEARAAAVAGALEGGDWSSLHNGPFLNYCGKQMRTWIACCEALVG
jgi:hypothetical protein